MYRRNRNRRRNREARGKKQRDPPAETRDENKTSSTQETVRLIKLIELPYDVLLAILNHCDLQSIGRLARVCKLFEQLVQNDCVWLKRSKHSFLIKDCKTNSIVPTLSLKQRCRVARNWVETKFCETLQIWHRTKQMPWLQYVNGELWSSQGSRISCHSILGSGYLQKVARQKLHGRYGSDVCRFVTKENLTVSGCRDGSVCGWYNDSGEMKFYYPQVHTDVAHCVDVYGDIVVSGSRDNTIKLFSHNNERRAYTTLDAKERVWSIAISPDGRTCLSGTSCTSNECPLKVWDLNSCQVVTYLGTSHQYGAGILDIQYESPTTVITCGYDTFLKMWDTRTGRCVACWEEPFDSALYSLQSDKDNTIVTGTARHGMVRRWDKRMRAPLQLYYSRCGPRSSPVYSLAFDSSHLYVALDLCVNLIQFDVY